MSSGRRKREKQQKAQERLKDKQARAAKMKDPSGGSTYAQKTWNKDGIATGAEPDARIEKW